MVKPYYIAGQPGSKLPVSKPKSASHRSVDLWAYGADSTPKILFHSSWLSGLVGFQACAGAVSRFVNRETWERRLIVGKHPAAPRAED